MKSSIVTPTSSHSIGDLLRNHAILSALPKDFMLQSSAEKTIEIDPSVTVDKLVPLIKGWKPIVATDSIVYFKLKNSIMSMEYRPGYLTIHVYSSDLLAYPTAAKVIEPFEKLKNYNKDDNGVWVNFSYMTGMNVDRNTQFMRCPKWDEIKNNYPAECQSELSRTMKMKQPWKDGRLMIWHGDPGSGKTFAIRSLLMAWRDQFNFVIVADPEKLMASPSYYYEVASAPNMNSVPGAQSQDDDDEDPARSKKKRLLFIIEDSGDLISTGSRQKHWDKFGKLLNITDGLVGQGREDIFLLTFNEKLDNIDPAVVRPGRCISQLEFERFSEEEVHAWLAAHGADYEPSDSTLPFRGPTLAELYQVKANKKNTVPVTV